MITLSIWIVVALVALIVFLIVLIWSSRRTHSSEVQPVVDVGIEAILPALAELTGGEILEGNAARILQNKGFFDAVLEEIAGAKSSIHYETYLWWTGDICGRFAEALAARAREGIEVRLIVDAVGGMKMAAELRETMDSAGVQIGRFHPWELANIGKINSRDHRKMAIIDGRVGFLMGHGIAYQWNGGGRAKEEWRDTAVRLEGPIVRDIQSLFLRNWLHVRDELVVDEKLFPTLAKVGEVCAHVTGSAPVGSFSDVEILYKVAIAAAQRSIVIQNPYFAPHWSVVDLLVAAVARGVDVQLMIPDRSDSRLVQYASHKFVGALLEGGVHVFYYQPCLAHQKIMVVDGVWSHVGSTNFDHRSLQINYEVSLGLLDRDVAAELTAAFEDDLEHSEESTLAEWQGRSLPRRVADNLAFMIRDQI